MNLKTLRPVEAYSIYWFKTYIYPYSGVEHIYSFFNWEKLGHFPDLIPELIRIKAMNLLRSHYLVDTMVL